MKIKLRFLSFFTVGLIGFVLYMGFVMTALFNLILPFFNVSTEHDFIAFIFVFALTLVSGGALFSFYFINPLLFMLHVISQLSSGNYERASLNDKIYTKHNRLKKKYFLYTELINDIYNLSIILETSKQESELLEQAKREWIRGISHDLNTPLSYILGYSALLTKKDYIWKEEEKNKFLDEIYSNGKYIEQLISGLKLGTKDEYSKTAIPINLTEFDLISFLQELTIEVANQLASEEYLLSFEYEMEKLNIIADKELLYRVFQNLIGNAIRHNPPNTEVVIAIQSSPKDRVTISVYDNGKGLDDMQKSFLTDSDFAFSNGHGLAVVKNVILAHKGVIEVRSMDGTGIFVNIPIIAKRTD